MERRKIVILLGIVVLLLIAGGVFWWWQFQEPEAEDVLVKFENPDNYIIKETPEGKVVENTHAGLTFKVPEGWRVEKIMGSFFDSEGTPESSISLSSQDVEIDPKTNIPKAGCGASVRTEYRYSEKEFHPVKNLIERLRATPTEELDEKATTIEVAGYPALKKVVLDNPEIGEKVSVQIPFLDGKIFYFDTLFVPAFKERCSQEFDKFLEGVSIE